LVLQPDWQSSFAQAILDPELAIPAGFAGTPHRAISERFAVYRNNVAVGLIEALRCAFPVVNRLVGDEFFGAMARSYALRYPPRSPVLLAYGADFPAFIAEFQPAATLPYLAEVARLEWLWLEAYHEQDAVPLTVVDLRRVPFDSLPRLRLILHPSVRHARFSHPAVAIWRSHQGDSDPGSFETDGMPECLLIVRPRAQVELLTLSSGALVFLDAVERGANLGEGVSAALSDQPDLPVAEMFSMLFGRGSFSGFVPDREHTRVTNNDRRCIHET
jgi:hypothetical protein